MHRKDKDGLTKSNLILKVTNPKNQINNNKKNQKNKPKTKTKKTSLKLLRIISKLTLSKQKQKALIDYDIRIMY